MFWHASSEKAGWNTEALLVYNPSDSVIHTNKHVEVLTV